MLFSNSKVHFYSILFFFCNTALARNVSWNITQTPLKSEVETLKDSGGYSLFLLRGLVGSSNCKIDTAIKQYGCVYVAECIGEKKEFSQCPAGVYYNKGTVASCEEVVETIGKYNLVKYTTYCIDDYNFDVEKLEGNSTVSYDDIIKSVKKKSATLGKKVDSASEDVDLGKKVEYRSEEDGGVDLGKKVDTKSEKSNIKLNITVGQSGGTSTTCTKRNYRAYV
ncbi:hypothetical protein BB561_003512 [Smittium simulii]|uniref:Chitin-binding type-2 domain-containing protein n=1 Tax=Smittium simulii TaxID=133385 RepID=A0A2T9YKU4_9FUNG|nr:hypothetical protein BB561_003512 [Smittium simulii]